MHIALIVGIGLWNAYLSYKIGKSEIKTIKEDVFNDLSEKNRIEINKLLEHQKIKIEQLSNSQEKEILKNRFGLVELQCVSIQHGDINTEEYKLESLIQIGLNIYKSSGSDTELGSALLHIWKYLDKYPDVVERGEYPIIRLKRRIENIDVEKVNELKRDLLKRLEGINSNQIGTI